VPASPYFRRTPEKALPGSSREPARQLGLIFASRTILIGVAFLVAGVRHRRVAIAWLFFADAALQVFDVGLSLAYGKGAVTLLPIAIGIVAVIAGRICLRATDSS